MNDEHTFTADDSAEEASRDALDAVAIVGMSVRLPGASDLEAFWRNLRDGVESVRPLSDEELLAAGVEKARLDDPNYVKARGVLEDIDLFDAELFALTPREAEIMDPQHRLFLEEAWTALEHAGWNPDTYRGAIGVFAGANLTGYLLRNLAPNEDLVRRVGPLQIRIRNDKDFLATLAAYKLNLKGPAINVQTACSSSLVAVSLACQSLLSYQCDMALAGGISVSVPNRSGYFHQEGVYAPDGHCRAFDAAARGTVLGDGVAIVVLKRLEDARADGDTVHATIRGFAVNNDGSLKLDYTAPSVDGQAEVISLAQSLGEIDPATIGYVEAHGTGTPLGDPIEVAALTQVFRAATDEQGFCALGSVKPNIGHLDAAAGTASLIKAVLALENREIPPTLHFTRPNPQLDLATSPFYVAAEPVPWQPRAGAPRRAGVSSFGVGGTNAHVVLEEAPAPTPSGPSRPWQLLALSARGPAALERAAANLAGHLEARADLSLADVASTLTRGRKSFEMRRACVCRDPEDAVAVLRGAAPRRLVTGAAGAGRPVAFLFSGIGDHYVGMGRGLYEHEPVFRAAVDEAAEILEPLLGLDPRDVLYPAGGAARHEGAEPDLRRMLGRSEADPLAARLDRTEHLHPVLFLVEHALARQWMAWGIRPEAMIGYSIGEYVAACLAGVFSLEGALRLVTERARVIAEQPGGAMLAVTLPEAELGALLDEERFRSLSLAAVNGPAYCVAAGRTDDVEALAAELARRGVVHRRLKARHPFHSRQLERALDGFRAVLRGIEFAEPTLPFLSNVTGTWITAEEATDPAYWAEHMCRTVRFGDGVAELLRESDRVLVEIGPGQSLTSIVCQSAQSGTVALPSLPHEHDPQPSEAFLLHSLGRLWAAGVEPDWEAFFAGEQRRRLPLPTYPFERRRYWVEPVERTPARPARSLEKKTDPGAWFYLPAWRQSHPEAAAAAAGPWLVLADEAGLGRRLAEELAAGGAEVVVAVHGEAFAASGERCFTLDSSRPEGYEALLRALDGRNLLPRRLVHLWSVPATSGASLDRTFYSLVSFAQAWGSVATGRRERELAVLAVSAGAFDVSGEDLVEPVSATLAGVCRVLPQEYPGLTCRLVDLPLPRGGEPYTERWGAALRAEVARDAPAVVALRGTRRWVRQFEPLRLGEPDPQTSRLRRRGVYVITGGLGGIGLTLADYLATQCAARLALIGRSPFPAPDTLRAWLEEHDPGDPTSRKIRRIRALEAAGAQVLVCRADVTRRRDVEEVRALVRERFGAIHGVIHAAGQPPGGLIQLKDRDTAAAVLAPKVDGTRILHEVFGAPELDFLLLCSSLTAVTGALGLVDHAAANAFLDAYAHREHRRTGTRTVAVNWDSWLEVGQAADAGVAARLEALLEGGGETPGTTARYPRWERRAGRHGQEETLRCRLSPDHWVVAEHRFRGRRLLPGTAYLEMALRALEDRTEGRGATLRDIVFSQPCRVDADRLLQVRLEPGAADFAFVVESAADGRGPWQEHARGRIEAGVAGAEETLEIPAAARWPVRELRLDTERESAGIELGERWSGLLKELRHVEDEGWARCELPAAFRAELDDFVLHPALADAVTGIARVLGGGAYLPLSYDEVRFYDRLPASLECHFRARHAASGEAETLVCDVTVADSAGRVVLKAVGYTLRRLDDSAVPAEAPPSQEMAGLAQRAPRPAAQSSLGLLPREGAEAFGRILTAALDQPQVLVSVRDFTAVLAEVESLTGARAAEHMALLGAGGERRAAARAPYAAPRNSLEAKLVELFEDMLGVGDVGIHDNFFDLGGNSLVATQLISRIREQFEVEIVLRALFESPTVAELSVAVVREQAAMVDEEDLTAALAELSQLSREEIELRLATDDVAASGVGEA